MAAKIKLKVFCPKEKQSELEGLLNIQASYDAFVVGESTAQQLEEIKTRFPVEDMSSYFNTINLKDRSIDTSRPRLTQSALLLEHPSYEDTTEAKTKKIKKGLHHYVVQFTTPVKTDEKEVPSTSKVTPVLPYKYSITFFTKKNLQQAKSLLNKSGVKTDTISLDNKKVIVDIRKARKDLTDLLSKLSQIHGVKRIDEVKIRKLFNN